VIAFRRSLGFAALAAALLLTPFAIGAAGDLDRTFDGDGKVLTDVGGDDYAFDVAIQSDGKIVTVGSSYGTSPSEFVISRYTASGALDSTFGGGGIVRPDFGGTFSTGSAVAIQPDGKIVVAGQGSRPGGGIDFILGRYNADGSLDASFDGDGRVFTDFGRIEAALGLAIQSDGKIVAAGYARTSVSRDSYEFGVARYNPDGGLDASFDGDGRVITSFTPLTDIAVDVVVQPNGKIVVGGFAGYTFDPPNTSDFALARYNADGSLDSGLDGDGMVVTTTGRSAEDVALQADGKILLAGQRIMRYTPQGSIDSSFGEGGQVFLSDISVSALLVQPDAKIIAVGQSGTDFGVMRLDSKGAFDETFGGGRSLVTTDIGPGTDDAPLAVALQRDRRIVVAGVATIRGQPANFALARYLNPAPPQCVVPNVRGKTLRIARRNVARGRCAVGRVTRKLSKRVKKGRVISQSRRPGLRLPAGSRVNLVISKGRPRSR
jgi:uncharacterized delta-60 repeat protein